MTLETRIVIKQFIADVEAGRVTAFIKDFSQLHDYGDANERLIEAFEQTHERVEIDDETISKMNSVIREFTEWLNSLPTRDLIVMKRRQPII